MLAWQILSLTAEGESVNVDFNSEGAFVDFLLRMVLS
jgi:hypothetical protein